MTEIEYVRLSDSELVELFRKGHDQRAFETLVRRHHQAIIGRFRSKTGNLAEAEDLSQQLWMRVIDNIDSYDESGLFENYVTKISSNLLNDLWRRRGVRESVDVDWSDNPDDIEHSQSINVSKDTTSEASINREAIHRLVTEFIPNLPVEQRTIYLLRHESEFWETKQPMQWQQLAELNGIDVETAWQRFDEARRTLLTNPEVSYKDSEECCVFFVWTQAQRPNKQQSYTESDFAQMLDVPVNTLKTRYRSAIRSLSDSLDQMEGTT